MGKATVAIVLSNYNHGRYLPESLGAICGQTHPADEIVVIDDASTDHSAAVIEDFARRHSNIRFLRNERNLGLQESIARALPMVTSDYLVWAASDDRLLPEFLEKSMTALERHPRAGLCFSELSVLKGDTGEIERFATVPRVEHIFSLSDLPDYMPPAEIVRRMRRAYLPITSNSVVVRRDALLALGGYPKDLEWHADSFAYTVVALRHGACVVAETLALLRANPGSYSHSGMRDPVRQNAVFTAMLERLARPDYRDIRVAFRRCPSNFSPWHPQMLKLQLSLVRNGDLLLSYLMWKIGEYKRRHRFSWPKTFWRLGLRVLNSILWKVPVWGPKMPGQTRREREVEEWIGADGSGGPPTLAGAPGSGSSSSATTSESRKERLQPHLRPATRGSPTNLAEKFTLMVPTYNRPLDLARLLRYLARQSAAFPILVLDSGSHESRAINAALVAELGLDIRVIAYNASMTPFEKFWQGSEQVTTDFCSLCADDDVIMLDSLPALVGFLEGHADFSAAHGWYFSFYSSVHLGVTSIVYSGPSLDRDDPLLRVREMFNRYEAVTYAVYRTDVMRQVLREVQSMESMLARELLAGALTAVCGKVGRLPMLYYGRSLGRSQPYDEWHPIDFLISSPERLVLEYSEYRQRLLGWFQKSGYKGHDSGELRKLIDLVHMKYLSEYVTPDVMNYLIDAVMAGSDGRQILEGVWPRLAASGSPVLDVLRRSKLLRKLRDRFAPGFRLHDLARLLGTAKDQTVRTRTFGGQVREYRLYKAFLSELARTDGGRKANAVDGVIRALNAYE